MEVGLFRAYDRSLLADMGATTENVGLAVSFNIQEGEVPREARDN